MQGSNDNSQGRKLGRHQEVSETLRRCMMTQLGFCLFCLLTLASPDAALVTAEKIQVPIVDMPIPFLGFLVVAPSILIAQSIYLHVFEHERLKLESALDRDDLQDATLPTLFNLHQKVARLLSGLIFYGIVPLTLGAVTYKALWSPVYGLAMIFVFVLVTAALACLRTLREFRRLHKKEQHNHAAKHIILYHVSLVCLLFLYPSVTSPANPQGRNLSEMYVKFWAEWMERPLHLAHADLSGAKLSEADLSGADLSHARLERTDLSRANLRGANLSSADLHAANLQYADLREAKLPGHLYDLTENVPLNFSIPRGAPVYTRGIEVGYVLSVGNPGCRIGAGDKCTQLEVRQGNGLESHWREETTYTILLKDAVAERTIFYAVLAKRDNTAKTGIAFEEPSAWGPRDRNLLECSLPKLFAKAGIDKARTREECGFDLYRSRAHSVQTDHHKIHFDHSVEGLEIGAPVRLGENEVGHVNKIESTHEIEIRVLKSVGRLDNAVASHERACDGLWAQLMPNSPTDPGLFVNLSRAPAPLRDNIARVATAKVEGLPHCPSAGARITASIK